MIAPLSCRLNCEIERRVDPRPLAVARILVGIAALALTPLTLLIVSLLIDAEQARVATIPGVVLPVSPALLAVLSVVWIGGTLAFLVGWRTRAAGVALVAALVFAQILDHQVVTGYSYLITLIVLLLTLTESGAAWSLDARRGGARRTVPGWPARLLNVQLSLVYSFTALAKINGDYLSGAILSEAWRPGGIVTVPVDRLSDAILSGMAVASILTEGFLAFAFWFRRLRPVALIVGVGLHTSIVLTMGHVYVFTLFGVTMFALYATYFTQVRSR